MTIMTMQEDLLLPPMRSYNGHILGNAAALTTISLLRSQSEVIIDLKQFLNFSTDNKRIIVAYQEKASSKGVIATF